MKNHFLRSTALLIALSAVLFYGCNLPGDNPSGEKEMPRLEKRGNVTQLIVDGKPYLALAGELHNSSSSSAEYMKPVWPQLKAMGLNTVLAVVSWEQVEPEEGKFDFSTVDAMLRDARANNMRLVLLWFGSWKNGITSYVPSWVKADRERFPYIKTKDGATLPILTTFGSQTLRADTKAYTALMKYIREKDSVQRTVIMMQMQNEVGIHGDTKDYSPEAIASFSAQVPAALMTYITGNSDKLLPELRAAWDAAGGKSSGTWEEVFGKGDYTDEIFTAWNYSLYLNAITVAGKTEYPLPVFTNTWIVQPEDNHPGDYPVGGAVAQVHDIWRAGAPAIDMLCPDIYLPDFPSIVRRYSRSGNPVFIPESAAGVKGAANAFFAVGEAGAIGYSPFGIESRSGDPQTDSLASAYRLLAQMSDKILEHQAAGTIHGAWLSRSAPQITDTTFTLGKYNVKFELRKTIKSDYVPPMGYGLVMMTGEAEYVVAGFDVQVTFSPVEGGIAALDIVQEGEFVKGRWVAERWLNGDETQLRYDLKAAQSEGQSGFGLRFRGPKPTIQKVTLYNYK